MNFAILNASQDKNVTTPLVQAIASACERQLYECYAPLWQSTGCPVRVVSSLSDVVVDDCLVVILDDPDEPNALGYHAVMADGRPFSRVFTKPILDNGGGYTSGSVSLSVTISHEIIEARADPYASWWCDGNDGTEWALEPGDPVEGFSYEIDGIAVSDFCGPRFFSIGSGPYDWLGLAAASFTVSAGGYAIRRNPGGDAAPTFGSAYPEWKKPLKQRITRRRRSPIHTRDMQG